MFKKMFTFFSETFVWKMVTHNFENTFKYFYLIKIASISLKSDYCILKKSGIKLSFLLYSTFISYYGYLSILIRLC